jgi:hypothetical protein
MVGDEAAALKAVRDYFSGPFREQIVSSGEQVSSVMRSLNGFNCLVAIRIYTDQAISLPRFQLASDSGESGVWEYPRKA